MSKRRKCKPNLTYHIYSRCINKENFLNTVNVKDLMINVIKDAQKKYKFNLISYVIMHTHFHFLIKTVVGGANISQIMQFIKSQFARRYNKLMGRTGPFWNERFGDTIIEDTSNPELTFHYINSYVMNNPVKARYVSDARKYKYCSINFYLDEDYIPPVKLTYHEYFLKLGNSFKERVKKFLEFEEMYKKRIFPESVFSL